jgi:hypothetical protein
VTLDPHPEAHAATSAEPVDDQATPPGPAVFGVNIHTPFQKTVYRDVDALFDCVRATGATWVRDNLAGAGQWAKQLRLWQRFRDAGIGVDAIVGAPSPNPDSARLATFSAELSEAADCLIRVEGWNEPDNDFPDWVAKTVENQRWLWGVVKGDPALAHVTVLGPSLRTRSATFSSDIQAVYAKCAGCYDLVNVHCYPGGGRAAEWYLDDTLKTIPAGPAIITEAGYNTGLGVPRAGTPVDPETQARLTLDYVRRVNARGMDIAIYELLDDPDPDNTTWEAHWGFWETPALEPSTWVPKPILRVMADAAAGRAVHI